MNRSEILTRAIRMCEEGFSAGMEIGNKKDTFWCYMVRFPDQEEEWHEMNYTIPAGVCHPRQYYFGDCSLNLICDPISVFILLQHNQHYDVTGNAPVLKFRFDDGIYCERLTFYDGKFPYPVTEIPEPIEGIHHVPESGGYTKSC